MKYLSGSFSVGAPGTDEYRNNWDRIFGTPKCEKCGEPKTKLDATDFEDTEPRHIWECLMHFDTCYWCSVKTDFSPKYYVTCVLGQHYAQCQTCLERITRG